MIKPAVIGTADLLAETLLSRRLRERIGRHLLSRARGDDGGDMERNGERALIARLQQMIAGQAVVVLDVGANVGEWSVLVGRGLDRCFTSYAFEPVAAIFARLLENLARLRPAPRL